MSVGLLGGFDISLGEVGVGRGGFEEAQNRPASFGDGKEGRWTVLVKMLIYMYWMIDTSRSKTT